MEENICSNEDSISNALKSTDKNEFSAFEMQKQLFLAQVHLLEQMLAQILIKGFTECTNWEQIEKVFMKIYKKYYWLIFLVFNLYSKNFIIPFFVDLIHVQWNIATRYYTI